MLHMPKDSKRATEAADQMWKALCTGYTFEVPATLSTDDLTTQAVLILRRKHPQVVSKMLQSRGIVLSLGKPTAVGDGAWSHLARAGYFPGDELPPELFFAQHAKFMRQRADIDPEEAVKQALAEDKKFNAISIGKK